MEGSAAENPHVANDTDVKYRIVKSETSRNLVWAALTCLIPPLRSLWPSLAPFACETHPEIENTTPVWQESISLIIVLLLLAVKLPLAFAGYFLEWFLNFYQTNNRIIGLLSKLIFLNIKGIVFSPKEKDRSRYYSVIGWLDQRTDLIYPQSSKLKINPNTGKFHYDSKSFVDLCMMASKLSYESRYVQEPIVNKQWNMCFRQFYECQNVHEKPMGILQGFIHRIIVSAEKHLGKNIPFFGPLLKTLDESTILHPRTQAFTFTDKPRNADLVVLAFRGTEPFNADDWSTDLDFSFVELDDIIGRLHVGFLEALGLVNRDEIEDSAKSLKENLNDPNKELTTGLTLGKLQSMAAKNFPTSEEFHNHSGTLFDDIEIEKQELAHRLSIFERINADLIQILKENPEAQLVITGHSLGGALAALFAALVLYKNVKRNEKKLLAESLAAVYTFGPPRVGDKVFSSFMSSMLEKHKIHYYRVVYAYDLVPRVPFDDGIFGFKHFGFCCYYNILYQQKALIEQPNKNFLDVMFYMIMRISAAWELVKGMVLNRVWYGDNFRDSGLMALARFVALMMPGVVAHAPTNYINAIRLGPSHLKIVPI